MDVLNKAQGETKQEYCRGYEIISNISPTVEIQFHSSYQTNTQPEGEHSNLTDTVSKGYTADIKESEVGEGQANG